MRFSPEPMITLSSEVAAFFFLLESKELFFFLPTEGVSSESGEVVMVRGDTVLVGVADALAVGVTTGLLAGVVAPFLKLPRFLHLPEQLSA